MVTVKELQSALDSFKLTIVESIDEHKKISEQNTKNLITRIDTIVNKIGSIEEKVTSLAGDVDVLTTRVESDKNILDDKIQALQQQVMSLTNKVAVLESLPAKVQQQRELTEERTNRQLRETLVFKNVPEGEEKTYADTKKILSQLISQHCDLPMEVVSKEIKRAHRETKRRNNDNFSRNGKRHIFAAFHSWDLTQKIIEDFKKKNFQDNTFKIYAEQKFGPLTSKRRSLALAQRKELKEVGAISGGYVSFPAKLFVNFTGQVNSEGKKIYTLHSDFSKHEIDS